VIVPLEGRPRQAEAYVARAGEVEQAQGSSGRHERNLLGANLVQGEDQLAGNADVALADHGLEEGGLQILGEVDDAELAILRQAGRTAEAVSGGPPRPERIAVAPLENAHEDAFWRDLEFRETEVGRRHPRRDGHAKSVPKPGARRSRSSILPARRASKPV
jgi:hypothetical protein